MGIVTEYLIGLIEKQIKDYGIVVWYDPEEHYNEVVNIINIPDTNVERYDESFFDLRYRIEPLLSKPELPRLLVYVPISQSETHHALVEVEMAGVVMQPGQSPLSRNTRISVVTRHALRATEQWTNEDIETVVRGIDTGQYASLAEIERVAEQCTGSTGILQLIFNTKNPTEIALQFLSNDTYETKIEEKQVLSELMQLMEAEFGAKKCATHFESASHIKDYRNQLARHILATDFLTGLKGDIPQSLENVRRTLKVHRTSLSPAQETCRNFCHQWRERNDLQESYATHANRVEQELRLSNLNFERQQISDIQTFQVIERKFQQCIETELLSTLTGEHVEIARKHQSNFWSQYLPDEIQSRWIMIIAIGQLLLEADHIEEELKFSTTDAKSIFDAYTRKERPWCLMDTYHRNMERHYYHLDFTFDDQGEQLISRARRHYMEVSARLIETFLERYQEAKFRIDGVLQQREIYKRKIAPELSPQKKVAYIWVDALRYEMARDLIQDLVKTDVTIESALATVPAITEIGMAALLPFADESFTIISAEKNKLGVKINNTTIKNRDNRVKFLAKNTDVKVFETKLERILTLKKNVKKSIEDADLILITLQKLDRAGEEEEAYYARKYMGEEVLRDIGRAIRRLFESGVQKIILTADHGHLFGEDISNDMKIDAPGGNTATLHRRVWIGEGGSADPACLRAKLSDFDIDSEFELATPCRFAVFKTQGSKAYFHGGLSPQELIIPVVTLIPEGQKIEEQGSVISWELILGKSKITTRFYTVQIKGTRSDFFGTSAKVHVEIRAKGKIISQPVAASYGFEEATGDVQLKFSEEQPNSIEPNTVTLMITDTSSKNVSVCLLDATTNMELARIDDIKMSILAL